MAEWIGRVPTCQAVLNECKGTKRKKKKHSQERIPGLKYPCILAAKECPVDKLSHVETL